MKTLRTIATESGLSKTAVRKRAQRAGVLDQLTRINGTLYADEDQEAKILEGLTVEQITIDDLLNDQPQPNTEPTRAADPEDQEQHTQEAEDATQAQEDAQDNAQLPTPTLQFLMKQLEAKDQQIKDLMDQNRELLRSLQYEQSKNKQIATAEPTPAEPAEEPKTEEPKQKRSIWQWIFGK